MTRMHAGIKTANAVNPMDEVINQAHALSGNRMKFNDPSSWPTQNKAIDVIHRTTPNPWPGPEIEPTAFSGAYCVQPPRVGPSPTKNDDMSTRKETKVTQNDIMLKRGKGISSAPTWIGKKKLPKAAKGAVVSTKKTMIVPCMVINCR